MSIPGAGLLSGCADNFEPQAGVVENEQTPLGDIQGSVHGGNAPVTGAQIYVMAAGTGGNQTAATSLIPSSKNGVGGVSCSGGVSGNCYITTDSNGNFNLFNASTGYDYTCTQGQAVYLVAVGGNPGLGGTVNNTAIVQMAGLGICPASGTMASISPYVVINEVSTVAFAYAMGSFGIDAFHIASSATALGQTGMANAMANAHNIEGLGWGGALANANGNSNSVAPQTKLNSLADIVATCVNTNSSTSTSCKNLFGDAKSTAGTTPTDESTALFNIAHNPTANVSAIWGLYPSQPVFTPVLSGVPVDWTLPVVYNSVTGHPSGMAVDASGNVWVSDSTKKAVISISPIGTVSTFTNGGTFGAIAGVAVNPSTGTIWASDSTNNKVYILDTTGTVLTTITAGSLNKPAGIAFDKSGNGWVVNSGAYVIGEYTSAGALVKTATYPSSAGYSTSIAADYYGDVFVTGGSNQGNVVALQPGSTSASVFGNMSGTGTYVVALDATSNTNLALGQYWTAENNVWVLGSGGLGEGFSMIVETSSPSYTYGTANQQTYLGWIGGINPNTSPSSMAFDGAGNFWVANQTPAASSCCTVYPLSGVKVSGTNVSGMSSAGFTTGTATGTGAYLAVPDGAGNVWVANTDGSVSQIFGMATPVVTPIVPGKFATAP